MSMLTIIALLLCQLSTTASAAEYDFTVVNDITEQTSEAEPRINWTGTAYISTIDWCNIVSDNNAFPDSPKITSDANNPGTVTVRVKDEDGNVVGSTKTLKAGESVRLDQIPMLSGVYTIQAIASTTSGTYTFHVT